LRCRWTFRYPLSSMFSTQRGSGTARKREHAPRVNAVHSCCVSGSLTNHMHHGNNACGSSTALLDSAEVSTNALELRKREPYHSLAFGRCIGQATQRARVRQRMGWCHSLPLAHKDTHYPCVRSCGHDGRR
jgi:hypothetical protein